MSDRAVMTSIGYTDSIGNQAVLNVGAPKKPGHLHWFCDAILDGFGKKTKPW